jgi:hypothetical protein
MMRSVVATAMASVPLPRKRGGLRASDSAIHQRPDGEYLAIVGADLGGSAFMTDRAAARKPNC